MTRSKKSQKQKNWELLTDNKVSKAHALNEIRNSRMTTSQARLFAIYLSKVDPRNKETREVTFRLDEYAKIMEFSKVNTTRLKRTAEELLSITVTYWDDTGEYSSDGTQGFVMCQLFKRFKFEKNSDDGEWYVSIDCHDDTLHLIFELTKYLSYPLWNVLPLTKNQQRMYELLKQYEKAGERVMKVNDLREWLWIEQDEYLRWDNFKTRILDACKIALARNTDIKFLWEVTGKRGRGGKINALRFTIEKNTDYTRKYTLDDYNFKQEALHNDGVKLIETKSANVCDDLEYMKRINYLMEACGGEFTFADMVELDGKMSKNMDVEIWLNTEYCYNYLEERYTYMENQSRTRRISDRLGYMKLIVEYAAMQYIERIEFLMDACKYEFDFEETVVLSDKMRETMKPSDFLNANVSYHHLNDRYKYMDLQGKKREIINRFNYLSSIVGKEI